jgi:hypothetical protein
MFLECRLCSVADTAPVTLLLASCSSIPHPFRRPRKTPSGEIPIPLLLSSAAVVFTPGKHSTDRVNSLLCASVQGDVFLGFRWVPSGRRPLGFYRKSVETDTVTKEIFNSEAILHKTTCTLEPHNTSSNTSGSTRGLALGIMA